MAEPDPPAPDSVSADAPAPVPSSSEAPREPIRSRRLIALIPGDKHEPASGTSDREALAIWAAVSGLWHPALLARSDRLPEIEDLDQPVGPEAGEIRALAPGLAGRLPSGYRVQAEDAGAILVDLESSADRTALARAVLERLDPGATLEPSAAEGERVRMPSLTSAGSASTSCLLMA